MKIKVLINRIIFLAIVGLVIAAVLNALFFKGKDIVQSETTEVVADNQNTGSMILPDDTENQPIGNETEKLVDNSQKDFNLLFLPYDANIADSVQEEAVSLYIRSKSIPLERANELARIIVLNSKNIDLNPLAFAAIISSLSAFNSDFEDSGREGIMLLSKTQSIAIAARDNKTTPTGDFLKDDATSIQYGAQEIKYLASKFSGDLATVLAAFFLGDQENIRYQADSQQIQAVKNIISQAIEEALLFVPSSNSAAEVAGSEKMVEPLVKNTELPSNSVSDTTIEESKEEIKEAAPSPNPTPQTARQEIDSNNKTIRTFFLFNLEKPAGLESAQFEAIIDLLISTAKQYGLDPFLLIAIAQNGSKFVADFKSSDGKVGLLQINESQVGYISQLIQKPIEVPELLEASKNIDFAAAYLNFLLELFNNKLDASLIAYHWSAKQLTESAGDTSKIPENALNFSNQVIATVQNWQDEYLILKQSFQD